MNEGGVGMSVEYAIVTVYLINLDLKMILVW